MIDAIVSYVLLGVLVFASLLLYVFSISCLLPHFLLKLQGQAKDIRDRGVRKYLFEQGRAIVYEPAFAIRKYISQYILSTQNGERFLTCKINRRVTSLQYSVSVFDADDRLLTVLDVSDPVDIPEMGRAVPLPYNTAYVSVSVKEVNGMAVASHAPLSLSWIRIGIFALCTVVLTVIEALVVKSVLRFFADLLFSYSDKATVGNGYTVFTAILIGIFYAALVLLIHHSRDIKYVK